MTTNACICTGKMPEGPEVRILVDGLRKLLLTGGEPLPQLEEIIQVSPFRAEELIPLDSLLERTLEEIRVHGKLIIFCFSGEEFLTSSLGMTGGWCIDDRSHRRFSLRFSTQTIHYCDVRYFGRVRKLSRGELDLKLSKLGPDPFSPDFSLADVYRLKKTTRPIGVALLDQSLLAGIGNYLKSDILWAARIDPRRRARDLSHEEIESLFHHIQERMDHSYSYGGYSMRDYFHLDGSKGGYVPLIYGREHFQGEEVFSFKLGGRVTYMVKPLQR